MLSQIRPAASLIALFTLLCGVVLPLAFTGLGALALPYQSGGSLIVRNGKVIGSAIIGQNFVSDKYVHGRPSALMGADPKDSTKQIPTPYDAGESGASNLAPTSKALIDRVKADVAKLGTTPVPGDAVTTSGSGLDPDISPEAALLQVARVAKARGVTPDAVRAVLAGQVQAPRLGIFGGSLVNVLATNLALDAAFPAAASVSEQAGRSKS
jgi:K+-transporting ATPase ATPase C chain